MGSQTSNMVFLRPSPELQEFDAPDQSGETDEEPDVDDIEIGSEENVSNCVNDNISKVLEVYDEETCLETMRGYYETAFEKKLPETCKCFLQGCEFDPLSNTYRLQATLSLESLDLATHYLVVKLDYAEGIPKLCTIR